MIIFASMKRKDGFKGERSVVLPKAVIRYIEDDPVASQLFITDIGYYPKAGYHYRKRFEGISEYVFIYCVDGKGHYEIDGKRFDVSRDQYFILPLGQPHEYAADDREPWSIYWIHFRGNLAQYYVPDSLSPIDIRPGVESRIHNRISLFEEVFRTLDQSFAMENIRYAMVAFQHYLASLRYLRQYRAATGGADSRDVVDVTIHYLEENIERHLSLKDICDYAGLSSSRLSCIFKRRIGYSPIDYFILLKTKKACDLLDNTEMKINQISLKLGFSDQYYFSRQFSHIMGMSPTSYRSRPKS